MITRDEFLWVQKYRPKNVSDLILSEDIKETLTAFVEKGIFLTFYFIHSQVAQVRLCCKWQSQINLNLKQCSSMLLKKEVLTLFAPR